MSNEETLANLTGRIVFLETLMTNMLGRFVLQYDKPIELLATVIDATESSLLAAKQTAPDAEGPIIDAALASYRHTSAHLMAVVNVIASPQGRG